MPDTPNYYSVKVVIRDEANMVFVMFAAILDPVEVKTLKFEGVASGTPQVLISTRSTFQDFCNRVQRVIYKGDQLKNITKSLQESLKTSFSSESVLTEILHYIDHNLVDRLEFIFSQIHSKIAGKSNPIIEIHYEVIEPLEMSKTTIDEDELARKEAAAAQTLPPSAAGFIIPVDKQLIQFRFQLSPVNGTPLTDLKSGDTVFIRLVPGDAVTDGIINSLGLKNEDGVIQQVPAKIVNISNSRNVSEVVVKINEQVYGKIMEEENSVKIKTFDSNAGSAPLLTSVASVTAASKSKVTKKDSADVSHILPFMFILGLVAIGLVAIFFFI